MGFSRIVLPVIYMLAAAVASAQDISVNKLEQILGRPGKEIGGIYKFGFPRTDLHVTVQGVAVKPGLALGSWAAFSQADNTDVVMGDLVLLPEEVNPVMAKLRADGFEITALHNHLLFESPRVMYMHYFGRGDAQSLARSLHAALALSKTPVSPTMADHRVDRPGFVSQIEDIVGRKGHLSGGVLGFGIPRKDAVTLDGMTVPPAMGVAEGINFQQAGQGKVATTGDFVLTAREVNPVISALEDNNILVTALHTHMLEEQPRLFFMHFWGTGTPQAVARGIKAALEQIAVQ